MILSENGARDRIPPACPVEMSCWQLQQPSRKDHRMQRSCTVESHADSFNSSAPTGASTKVGRTRRCCLPPKGLVSCAHDELHNRSQTESRPEKWMINFTTTSRKA